jgi:uncharacterized membrane protein
MQKEKNYLQQLLALFDLSFSEFLFPKLIKVLYILGLVNVFLFVFGFVITSFRLGFRVGIFTLLVSPIILIISIITIRVYMELLIVIFRIAEYIRDMANQSKEEVD